MRIGQLPVQVNLARYSGVHARHQDVQPARRLALPISFPALASEAPAPDAETKDSDVELEEVVAYATIGGLVAGLYAESELGEDAIAAYCANTPVCRSL